MGQDKSLSFHLIAWVSFKPTPADFFVATDDPNYSAMAKLAGDIFPGQEKRLPAWPGFMGLITMHQDSSTTYYMRQAESDGGERFFALNFPPESPAAAGYIKSVGGLRPGDIKPVPTPPKNIGVATMLPDGTIKLYLRRVHEGAILENVVTYKPGDPNYQATIDYVGGLKTGDQKPIPPLPADQ
jgi:hypothetical protein